MKEIKRIATYRDFLGELTLTYRRTEKKTQKVTSSKSAADFLRSYYDKYMDDREEFKILHLNRNNLICNVDEIGQGTDTGILIDTKTVVRNALQIKVHGVILSHSHPSGSLRPSQADRDLTKKLKEAFAFFDITVLDHIIMTRESYYSFADEGIL